jgi:DNA polymerase III epsilon subunit-like protein
MMEEFIKKFSPESILNRENNNTCNYLEDTNEKKNHTENIIPKVSYNEEQLKFIQSPITDCKLLGIPGGGKTQSIIGKVIYHYAQKELTKNNQFIILSFSRRACDDFIQKGKKQNKKFFNTKNIRTLHSLAGKIVYKILEKRSSSQDTVIVSAISLIDIHAVEICNMDEFSSLKVIFVDEAQDISDIQYEFIQKISNITKCKVILIGDPNQNIYQFQKGSDRFLINHSNKQFSLIKNYRSTPHIVNFVNYFRPWDSLTPKMISTKKDSDILNKKPVIFTGTIEEIINDVTTKILNSSFPREEIAIIGPVKKSKPNQDSYTNIGLSLFTNLLSSYNIDYIKHYEDTNNDEDVSSECKKVKNHINLFTVHGSKGLEFNQVFLLNFHSATFGIIPTEEKYKEFKYLWYVGLSRAEYDLHIYIDKSKMPWNELKNCPLHLYTVENSYPEFKRELQFKEEIIPVYYTVTELLNSKKYLDDSSLFKLENIFKFDIEKIPIFDNNDENNNDNNNNDNFNKNIKTIKNYKSYCALYGILIENIFNYYYNIKFKIVPDFLVKLKKIINNTVVVTKEYIIGYKILKQRCPFIIKDLVKLADFSKIKNQFRKSEEYLYAYLCETLNNDFNKEFFIDCENDVINYSKNNLLESITYLEHDLINLCSINEDNESNKANENLYNRITLEHIFKITLYYYQRSHETAYLWKVDFSEELDDLEYYIKKVILYAINLKEEFMFHPQFTHSKLPILGELDMYNNNKIVDIKFSNNLNIKHIMQVIFYNHIINPNFEKNYILELWNFHLGYKYIIKINPLHINILEVLKILSKAIKQKLQNMIFIYDLETTGLPYQNREVDIIERYFEEYNTSIVPSKGLVKPVNCSFIPYEITAITGISTEMVHEKGDSAYKFYREISDMVELCKDPIFIAHNGNSFDHKILLNKNILTRDKCKFLDSKMIIRLFLNNSVVEKSLSEIFIYLFKFTPVVHRAESDVKMLISIFRKLGIDEDKILSLI